MMTDVRGEVEREVQEKGRNMPHVAIQQRFSNRYGVRSENLKAEHVLKQRGYGAGRTPPWNFGETRVLPNFPGRNFQNNAKGMLSLNDGKDVVAPFSGGSRGDVVLRTEFEPQADGRKFIEGYLGRPLSPISGLRNDVPASAQPPGLSAVRQPSIKNSMPDIPTSGKSKVPVIAGAGAGLAS